MKLGMMVHYCSSSLSTDCIAAFVSHRQFIKNYQPGDAIQLFVTHSAAGVFAPRGPKGMNNTWHLEEDCDE